MAPTPTRFALTPEGEAEADRLRPIANARMEAQKFKEWAEARRKLLASVDHIVELSGNVARYPPRTRPAEHVSGAGFCLTKLVSEMPKLPIDTGREV